MNLTEEQRRKVNQFIAEKRGWKWTYMIEDGVWHHTRLTNPKGQVEIQHGFGGAPSKKQIEKRLNEWPEGRIPDYTRSLDACHEALTWLSQNLMDAEQWEAFGHRVEEIHPTATLTTNSGVDYYDFADLLCSPSESIAVALFLTLGGEL